MAKKQTLMAVVQFETDDPRLFPGQVDVSTAEATATVRRLLVEHLADMTRVIAVTSEKNMRLMFRAHEAALAAIGLEPIKRPPADYVAPKDRR